MAAGRHPRRSRAAQRRAAAAFTLVELLLACALILFLANFILRLFSDTVDLTRAQVGTHQMYNKAMHVMDQIETDIRNMRTRNVRPGDRDVRLLGNFSWGDGVTDNHSPPSPPMPTGYTRLAFVTTFPESRLDKALSSATGNAVFSSGLDGTNALPYDGYVYNPSPTTGLLAPGGLQEVCYFLKSTGPGLVQGDADKGWINQDLLTLYRAVRSPIGTVTWSANIYLQPSANTIPLFNPSNASTPPAYSVRACERNAVSRNVIYFGAQYYDPVNIQWFSIWPPPLPTSFDFPQKIKVTLSLASVTASGQQEGVYDATSKPPYNVLLRNDKFRFVEEGYLAVLPDTGYGGVYKYKITDRKDRWLKVKLAPDLGDPDRGPVAGCPAPPSPAYKNRVLFGTTFTRTFSVGI